MGPLPKPDPRAQFDSTVIQGIRIGQLVRKTKGREQFPHGKSCDTMIVVKGETQSVKRKMERQEQFPHGTGYDTMIRRMKMLCFLCKYV